MLSILGKRQDGFCDHLSRRSFLRIGSLAMGGLALPQLLRAEAAAGGGWNPHKAVIMIYLPGGPPHTDMWDLKPDAPAEVRGEFKPIKTNVQGIEICELFPRLATMADKMVFLRSIIGSDGSHASNQCLSGRPFGDKTSGGWPCLGSVAAHLEGAIDPAVPPAIGLSLPMKHTPWGFNGTGGFLGRAYDPFTPGSDQLREDMVLKGVSLDRLRDRRGLLTSFDNFRREADASGTIRGLDAFQQQAFDVLTSSRLADALDLEKEDTKLRDRYGRGSTRRRDDGGPELLDQFLLARRLVEAGARCVTLGFNRWDWHNATFKQGREVFPMLDQGLSALIEDLCRRGMDKDVSVVVWGEFGRTPNVNKDAGRDHWPNVNSAVLALGGMRTGQVIGATDRLGGEVKERPIHFQEVHATIYHRLGIDPHAVTIRDLTGRPHYLVDLDHKPIAEVI